MCDREWRCIEVNATGWKIIDQVPVRFRRTNSAQPLPEPTKTGSLDKLRNYINIPKETQHLVIAYLLECWRSDTHYMILELVGEQGSGKSDAQQRLRSLVDPSSSPLRTNPKEASDIYVCAGNNLVVSYNNISHLPESYQDALCNLATGGAFSTRTLYTVFDESLLNIKRPVMLYGIPDLSTSKDLLDRLIRVHLPEIEDKHRITDTELQSAFKRDYSAIFAGPLYLLAAVLEVLPNMTKKDPPRMGDFAKLGECVSMALGNKKGEFLETYIQIRANGLTLALASSPVSMAVLEFMDTNPSWYGYYQALYGLLSTYNNGHGAWPQGPKGLADSMRQGCGLCLTTTTTVRGRQS